MLDDPSKFVSRPFHIQSLQVGSHPKTFKTSEACPLQQCIITYDLLATDRNHRQPRLDTASDPLAQQLHAADQTPSSSAMTARSARSDRSATLPHAFTVACTSFDSASASCLMWCSMQLITIPAMPAVRWSGSDRCADACWPVLYLVAGLRVP